MENQINLEVIDQMFAAQMSANESQERIEALRPQVMEAVEELIRQRGLPKKFTGIIEYHGFKIRVQRPKSYTWELNSQIKDENLDYYKKQHAMYEQLQADVKDLRRDMKRTGEKLISLFLFGREKEQAKPKKKADKKKRTKRKIKKEKRIYLHLPFTILW